MPPVKIQSPCGGCWAFIATTAVEYQTCINNNGSKTPLLLRQIDFIIFIKFDLIIVIILGTKNSEQQLIDCSSSYGSKGCSGGFYSQAWDYLMAVGTTLYIILLRKNNKRIVLKNGWHFRWANEQCHVSLQGSGNAHFPMR
jgi:hypothetical protein